MRITSQAVQHIVALEHTQHAQVVYRSSSDFQDVKAGPGQYYIHIILIIYILHIHIDDWRWMRANGAKRTDYLKWFFKENYDYTSDFIQTLHAM